MKRPGYGPYASGYLGKQDGALAASPAITCERGDELLARLLHGRQFPSVAPKPVGRLLVRAEPLGTPGAGSSLTGTGGGGTGHRHGSGTTGRWGQR